MRGLEPLLDQQCLPAADRRRSTERGAVLVEASVVGMLLLIITFGIIEFGLLLHQSNEAADAVRTGTRMASNSGTTATADYDILQSMKHSSTALGGGIDKVMVFKADPTTGKPQGACATFVATNNLCNVYDRTEIDNQSAVTAKGQSWKPSTRTPGIDYIGVKVIADHKDLTKLFPQKKVVGDNAVVLLASAGQGSSGPATTRVDGVDNGGDIVPPPGATDPNQDVGGGGGPGNSGPGGNA